VGTIKGGSLAVAFLFSFPVFPQHYLHIKLNFSVWPKLLLEIRGSHSGNKEGGCLSKYDVIQSVKT
jgi:hypothetical protein